MARLLTRVESAVLLREHSGLGANPDLPSFVLRRSTGLIGEVAAFLTLAKAQALAQGRERIGRVGWVPPMRSPPTTRHINGRASTVYGGPTEVQHNILARLLGL